MLTRHCAIAALLFYVCLEQTMTANGFVVSPTAKCFDKPCQNGGECIDNKYGFSCRCTSEYAGNTCQHLRGTGTSSSSSSSNVQSIQGVQTVQACPGCQIVHSTMPSSSSNSFRVETLPLSNEAAKQAQHSSSSSSSSSRESRVVQSQNYENQNAGAQTGGQTGVSWTYQSAVEPAKYETGRVYQMGDVVQRPAQSSSVYYGSSPVQTGGSYNYESRVYQDQPIRMVMQPSSDATYLQSSRKVSYSSSMEGTGGSRVMGNHDEYVPASKLDPHCLNGGTPAAIHPGVVGCYCSLLFAGEHCEMKVSSNNGDYNMKITSSSSSNNGDLTSTASSDNKSCLNGGKVMLNGLCQCVKGFMGANCEISPSVNTVTSSSSSSKIFGGSATQSGSGSVCCPQLETKIDQMNANFEKAYSLLKTMSANVEQILANNNNAAGSTPTEQPEKDENVENADTEA